MLWEIIFRTSWDCNVDCVKFFYYTGYSFLWPAVYKIKHSNWAIPQQCISWMSAPTLKIIISYAFMCKNSLHFYDLSFQHYVFLASCYWAINFVNVCSNRKLYATKLWNSSYSGAKTNLYQQNTCMASRMNSY